MVMSHICVAVSKVVITDKNNMCDKIIRIDNGRAPSLRAHPVSLALPTHYIYYIDTHVRRQCLCIYGVIYIYIYIYIYTHIHMYSASLALPTHSMYYIDTHMRHQCLCIYGVYIYICVYVYICTHIYIDTVSLALRTHCMYITHTDSYRHTHGASMSVYIWRQIYIYAYIYLYLYMHICICVYTRIYLCIRRHLHCEHTVWIPHTKTYTNTRMRCQYFCRYAYVLCVSVHTHIHNRFVWCQS